jgi:hypothetical protein
MRENVCREGKREDVCGAKIKGRMYLGKEEG